MTGKAR